MNTLDFLSCGYHIVLLLDPPEYGKLYFWCNFGHKQKKILKNVKL